MPWLSKLVDRFLPEIQAKDKTLREYLLGGLNRRERTEMEKRYVADQDAFDDLLAAEEDLIHGYLTESLPSGTRERFAMILSASVAWQEKVQLAQSILVVAAQEPAKTDPFFEDLFTSMYQELAEAAALALKQTSGIAPDPEEIVYEAFGWICSFHDTAPTDPLNIVGREALKRLYLAVAKRTIGQVVVDQRRRQGAIDLEDGGRAAKKQTTAIDFDAAKKELAVICPRVSRIFELRFSNGLNFDEIATTMGTSQDAACRDSRLAAAWFRGRLSGTGTGIPRRAKQTTDFQ